MKKPELQLFYVLKYGRIYNYTLILLVIYKGKRAKMAAAKNNVAMGIFQQFFHSLYSTT